MSKEQEFKKQRDRFLAFVFASADLFVEVSEEGKVTLALGATKGCTHCERGRPRRSRGSTATRGNPKLVDHNPRVATVFAVLSTGPCANGCAITPTSNRANTCGCKSARTTCTKPNQPREPWRRLRCQLQHARKSPPTHAHRRWPTQWPSCHSRLRPTHIS